MLEVWWKRFIHTVVKVKSLDLRSACSLVRRHGYTHPYEKIANSPVLIRPSFGCPHGCKIRKICMNVLLVFLFGPMANSDSEISKFLGISVTRLEVDVLILLHLRLALFLYHLIVRIQFRFLGDKGNEQVRNFDSLLLMLLRILVPTARFQCSLLLILLLPKSGRRRTVSSVGTHRYRYTIN